jgi:hypothetical protein
MTCSGITDCTDGKFSSSAWCFQCQHPRTFLPIFTANPANRGTTITEDDLTQLINSEAFDRVEALLKSALKGQLTKDANGLWVCIIDGEVCDLKWVYQIISMHPGWMGSLYQIAMNQWR